MVFLGNINYIKHQLIIITFAINFYTNQYDLEYSNFIAYLFHKYFVYSDIVKKFKESIIKYFWSKTEISLGFYWGGNYNLQRDSIDYEEQPKQ